MFKVKDLMQLEIPTVKTVNELLKILWRLNKIKIIRLITGGKRVTFSERNHLP